MSTRGVPAAGAKAAAVVLAAQSGSGCLTHGREAENELLVEGFQKRFGGFLHRPDEKFGNGFKLCANSADLGFIIPPTSF